MSGGPGRQGLSMLDEALRLIDALQAEPRREPPASGPEQAAHLGGECQVCPVCRGLAALREAHPDAVARIGRAVADLVAAFGDLAGQDRADGSQAGPEPAAGPRPDDDPPRPRLQRIDVTD